MADRNRIEGFTFGLLGVLGFSITLPATRLALGGLDPVFVGLGRALPPALLSALLLYLSRQSWPSARQWRGLLVVMLGVVVGFPLLSAWALQSVPASHGAIVLGLLPLATAGAGAWRTHERPSIAFWIASLAGSAAVTGYALSGGGLRLADLALLAAVAAAAIGYAEGARLARDIGSWQVICWALVAAAPLVAGPVAWSAARHGVHADATAWTGFAYVSIVSMFLAFLAWYRGLAAGGVARISQLQLLQPFMTLGFAALFLGERFGSGAMVAAVVVAGSIFVSRLSRIDRAGAQWRARLDSNQ